MQGLYLELKSEPLDEMSDREYEVFKQKDKACQDYMSIVTSTEAERKNAEPLSKMSNGAQFALLDEY